MAIHVVRPARAWCRSAILATAICGAVYLRAGAATVDSTFTGTSGGDWTTAGNWSPAGIPNNGGGNVYDVTAPLDDGVTLSNASISINNFSAPDATDVLALSPPLTIHSGTLLINGSASFGADQFGSFGTLKGQVFVVCGDPVNPAGSALLSMQSVANYDSTTKTLSDVDWTVGHDNTSKPGVTSTLRFTGADIVTLDNSNIAVEEPQANFTDENGNDALRDLASLTNASQLTFEQHDFTTGGDLSLSADSTLVANGCTVKINGSLANFDSSTGVLTGGQYGGESTGTIQFNNANILTNRASIQLNGGSSIRDQNGNDGLRNLAVNDTNAGLDIADQNFTTAGDFTNSGVLSLQSAANNVVFRINGTLTDYSPVTHTLGGTGAYFLDATAGTSTILRFNDADIVTNDVNISLVGQNANILDQNGNNGLRDLAVNGSNGRLDFDARNFTTGGDFTNDGIVSVEGASSITPSSTFAVTGNLLNYSSSTHTLTGGDYLLQGDGTAPATLEFASADIVTNAATIQLINNCGIVDQNNLDGLRDFAVNTSAGYVQLVSHDLNLPGTFTNAGTMEISSSTVSLPAGSSYLQTAGLTILETGTISTTGAAGATIQGGTLTGNGQITGHLHLTGGAISPGAGLQGTDIIAITGNVDASSSSAFSFDIGGTTRGQGGFDPITFATLLGYSALDITGSASLNGQLHVNMLNGFIPVPTDTFILMDAGSPITGAFTNAASGQQILSDDGSAEFFVYYGQGSPFDPADVVLSGFSAVPEPSCAAIALAGCVMLRRRKKTSSWRPTVARQA